MTNRTTLIRLNVPENVARIYRRALLLLDGELAAGIKKMGKLGSAEGVAALERDRLVLNGGLALDHPGALEALNYEMDRAGWIRMTDHDRGYRLHRDAAQISLDDELQRAAAEREPEAEPEPEPAGPARAYQVIPEGEGKARRYAIYFYTGAHVISRKGEEDARRDVELLEETFRAAGDAGRPFVVIGDEEDSCIVNALSGERGGDHLHRRFALQRAEQMNAQHVAPAAEDATSNA